MLKNKKKRKKRREIEAIAAFNLNSARTVSLYMIILAAAVGVEEGS
jgi:hypothetical protein